MPSTVEQSQRRRQRFEANGLCHLCGQEPRFKDNKTGKNCLLKVNARKVDARDQALSDGKCQECRLKPVCEGHKHCEDCLRQARERVAARAFTHCVTCGQSTGRKVARYCDDHRPTRNVRRKYLADERIAELIRELYSQGSAAREAGEIGKSSLRRLAKKIGWPYWAVQAEAARLGVARIKEDEWCAEELEILEKNAHWQPSTIRKRLRARGYSRSLNGIKVKRSRLRLASSHDYMSPFNLATNCFRVSPSVVKKWIKLGWLKAIERDVERKDTCHWIRREDVYSFVTRHPMTFDIRKVDQLWFIDLLTQGKVGLSLQEMNKESCQPSVAEMERNEFGKGDAQ